MIFENLCILVLWTKVALALEGLWDIAFEKETWTNLHQVHTWHTWWYLDNQLLFLETWLGVLLHAGFNDLSSNIFEILYFRNYFHKRQTICAPLVQISESALANSHTYLELYYNAQNTLKAETSSGDPITYCFASKLLLPREIVGYRLRRFE